VQVQKDFWVEKGRREEIQAFGTDEDKAARVKDFLATEVGGCTMHVDALLLVAVLLKACDG
jgi:hypothetical protein